MGANQAKELNQQLNRGQWSEYQKSLLNLSKDARRKYLEKPSIERGYKSKNFITPLQYVVVGLCDSTATVHLFYPLQPSSILNRPEPYHCCNPVMLTTFYNPPRISGCVSMENCAAQICRHVARTTVLRPPCGQTVKQQLSLHKGEGGVDTGKENSPAHLHFWWCLFVWLLLVVPVVSLVSML